MELCFLEHCFRWVIAEGVLVFVIPVTALGACAQLLASQFELVSVFRLGHPESVRFTQIVVFRKRKKSHARGDPSGVDALVRAGYHLNLIPALNHEVGEWSTCVEELRVAGLAERSHRAQCQLPNDCVL